MSVLRSLQNYLETFEGMELQPIMTDGVNTDTRYAIQPAGNEKTETDIVGNRTYINNYVFYARAYTVSEKDRQDNYKFLDGFFEWIEDNDDRGVYPEIEGYSVERLEAKNVLLFEVREDGRSIYQIQIQLRTKKGCA